MPVLYPFSAVLGCDVTSPDDLHPMGLALVLTSISPAIGGVLVRGEKGTAKSTTVRALADVLPPVRVHTGDRFSVDPDDAAAVSPDGPFDPAEVVERPVRLVELPVGAADDRVVGSLDLASALGQGEVRFEPGLLARAHRGVLYVDEVNLLGDHLVDLLLDAAATGRVTVERDAVSLTHAASFVLIGTMNPEEGELRPQLLDRFGLTVEVAAPREPESRVEVVRRRLGFDADPEAFAAAWATAQDTLRTRVEEARARLAAVQLTDEALLRIARVCAGFEVDGLRADIVTTRTAVAHAAWRGGRWVTRADIRAAALLALPHRRRRNPFDAPGLDEDLLDELLGDDDLPEPPEPTDPDTPDQPEGPDEAPQDGSSDDGAPDAADAGDETGGDSAPDEAPTEETPADSDDTADPGALPDEQETPPATEPTDQRERPRAGGAEQRVAAGAPYRPKVFTVSGTGTGAAGKRSKAIGVRGASIRAEAWSGGGVKGGLHLTATVRAAAERRATASTGSTGPLHVTAADLHTTVRQGREANLLLFCVDASGSMAARKRMGQVKAAILSLLGDAYRRRDKVGLVTFRGSGAQLVLPPTGSVDVAAALLDDLATGGRTPIAEGLLEAERVLRRERLRQPDLRPLLVLVTDGRATSGTDPLTRSRQAAARLAAAGVQSVLLDSESGPMRLGLGLVLATHLGAEHVAVEQLDADSITRTVRDSTTPTTPITKGRAA